jgi:SAM-dependent methyltransferase
MAEFISAYLRYLEIDVRRILDVGCGLGHLLRALARRFPRARTVGVEQSDYLCERYGWEKGSVTAYESGTPFDLVVCNDVLQYLDDRDALPRRPHGGRLGAELRPHENRPRRRASQGGVVPASPASAFRGGRRWRVSQAGARFALLGVGTFPA